ncbi:MAG: hypothetical protein BGO31_07810 [Bacteroidetes bacterium 43-16]|nr:MAG: hypothetical protein BGO31_07810 [Bacteroidetes bacterium 43-16]
MQSPYPILIIGQGIAGTLLSYELLQNKIPFRVIDHIDDRCASRASGAVLNPYSGRTIKGISRRSQMYQVARAKYEALQQLIGTQILHHNPLLVFDGDEPGNFNMPGALQAFREQDHVQAFEEVALVDNLILLKEWRTFLETKGCIEDHLFDPEFLHYTSGPLSYRDQQYSKIIFCTGVAARSQPFFSNLRFTENRGDVLMLQSDQLDQDYIYQKDKIRLLPRGHHTFWCGSNYLWDYENMIPNQEWAEQTIRQLQDWLAVPVNILDHFCAKRPTTAGQIPFIGWHPQLPGIGICNGLGTKGFSAGPMWIENFVQESVLNGQAAMFQYVLDKWCPQVI